MNTTTLSTLTGSDSASKTLLFIQNYGEAYCAEIANTYGVPASMIQKQLDKFEAGGVLAAKKIGRSRVYRINPRCVFKKELEGLLEQVLETMPRDLQMKFFRNRKRPRRKGKPL